MSGFNLQAPYPFAGDQPQAIEALTRGLRAGLAHQTLLGITGSGKTATMAGVIANLQRPTLVISPNKTLAAQLTSEFREFFPENAVEYFVSYYDYYQPEAYIPQSDTYIEKDSSLNQEIDRLRHSATQALLSRRDVVVVASVSCIYGLGSPQDYKDATLVFRPGEEMPRDFALQRLVDMQFERNAVALSRGKFRLKGEVLEMYPADEDVIVRAEFFGDTVERLSRIDPVTGEVLERRAQEVIYPAKHFITPGPKLDRALGAIQAELDERLAYFNAQGKVLEAQRLAMRTQYDLELLREIGYCNGIENYSRHLSGRSPGEPPDTLLDYFPDDFLVFIDESHVTVPQLRGMHEGDRARKDNLVSYGFRLPSAYDNRPLRYDEFSARIHEAVYVSATPAPHELKVSDQVVEQIIRPTGLLDPEIIVRPVAGQIDDLLGAIQERVRRGDRVLVTTLTKRMAEDLTEYLADLHVKARYLHSEVDTLERIQILRDLRLGRFDVLVGINLLREGLDLPEVSLVAVLDADKEGFLRSETSLIQTIGRAARHVSGTVILYADAVTKSMRRAIEETDRRRRIQSDHNAAHGITPESIRKAVRDILVQGTAEPAAAYGRRKDKQELTLQGLQRTMQVLEKGMREASKRLEFETAAALRDEMYALRRELSERLANTPLGPVAVEGPAHRPRRRTGPGGRRVKAPAK